MHALGIALLAILLFAIVLIVLVLWNRWEIRLHLKGKYCKAELRGLGIRKVLWEKDFSAEPEKKEAEQAEPSAPKNNKIDSLKARLRADKKRIYNPDAGGFRPDGIRKVFADYRRIWKEAEETFSGFLAGIRYKIEITRTEIDLEFGTGNPAHTGMAYAAVWNGIGIFYPWICRYFRMEYPYLSVTPDFNDKRFYLEIKSIIKVRPAHIIHAALRQGFHLLSAYLKNKKGSVKHG